ncbi:DUF1064 domain-containing protein [Mesorhizobium sp.]|uniref:DUF1064 domain-containing protein n=1 Tax=Mesorhizobium sp. TaxID=1871066 RepID=UPI000FE57E0A|nr:DUF1064 domain-containing protein [Mesorhizobium sp.]RWO22836.1 MAG: DUF1064 domain-containing protein [Mesorhizobium sp.]
MKGLRKYKNVPTVIDGISFASKREAHRYCELKLLERAGEISHLEIQPAFKFEVNGRPVLIRSGGFPNGRQAKYTADFAYFDGNHRIVEDVKSSATRTEAYALRKALVEAMFPAVRIVEI